MKETPTSLIDEMKDCYLAYSQAVNIGRAIPQLEDGLKPSGRRIMAAMLGLGLKPEARYMKAARVDGETSGKYHPHGGVFGAMVTLSQPWTMNNPLVDGWGNWGSPTDSAAASRYLECRLASYAYDTLLQDSKSWVTRPNYDGSLTEPVYLNAKVPNVLVNGGEGIGVAYTSKVPTHNLRGIAEAIPLVYEGKVAEASKVLIPDFPTSCSVVKDDGLVQYLNTGNGSIRLRANVLEEKVEWGKRSKRDSLVFYDLPIHTNTEQIGEQIKKGLESGNITTVADLRDETDLEGTRLVVVLKASASVQTAKNELYRYTSLDTKFSANNTVVERTKMVTAGPYELLRRWLEWRDTRLVTIFSDELGAKRERLEVVSGLQAAIMIIDDVIDEIKRSKDRADAKKKIMARDFTSIQAEAILNLRLSQLTKLDDKALRTEGKELQARIKELIKLNSQKKLRQEYIVNEIAEIAERHGNARRSQIIDAPADDGLVTVKQGRKTVTAEKPRFVKVDTKKGILTQLRKMTRGCTVVERDDKFVFVCDNGQVLQDTIQLQRTTV